MALKYPQVVLMNLHKALSEISEIKAQLDRTQTSRGFRSAATIVCAMGVVAVAIVLNRWPGADSNTVFVNA